MLIRNESPLRSQDVGPGSYQFDIAAVKPGAQMSFNIKNSERYHTLLGETLRLNQSYIEEEKKKIKQQVMKERANSPSKVTRKLLDHLASGVLSDDDLQQLRAISPKRDGHKRIFDSSSVIKSTVISQQSREISPPKRNLHNQYLQFTQTSGGLSNTIFSASSSKYNNSLIGKSVNISPMKKKVMVEEDEDIRNLTI